MFSFYIAFYAVRAKTVRKKGVWERELNSSVFSISLISSEKKIRL